MACAPYNRIRIKGRKTFLDTYLLRASVSGASTVIRQVIAWATYFHRHGQPESKISAILKQADGGTPVPELCREHGMSSALFYRWRSKFGGMDASMMARLKELEEENRRLKKMYAEE